VPHCEQKEKSTTWVISARYYHLCTVAKRRYDVSMKPAPAPNVPGSTDAERMSNALNMVLSVSKADLMKKEARLKRASEKKRIAKKPAS
jgi:hypothetical protein